MKTLKRTQFGNPILRAKAKSVPAAYLKTAAFRNLVKRMFFTMRRVHGVGLAAPQIGKSLRLAVIGIPIRRSGANRYFRRVLVNPKVTWHSKAKNLDFEGCLSFTDGRGEVPRWNVIKVEYTNGAGKGVREKHTGFIARVFQHEIDHLNGLVYVDRMTDMRTLMTHKEFMGRIVK
ncbi:MAG: peptide deformylase [Candidatus Liptonbacteria bacterium RIFCSPHIGHO2_01_FULL_57_28]|uniref:Peptide deformylase n=1 Tax=Candidatus Liptonbacteria bacterium RIFCSPHIGHO2_01_FULL_57_28 TaxID=1798647 RepID=A0A1G2CBR5_9BACT|nr:MAG: peptide deformylase [Candidatus Liptonbacteria bacterium RIFCSPHIGHO2_01_FULL_57_28]